MPIVSRPRCVLLPEPVAIVTTVHDGHKHGMTATAFASVSGRTAQILVCVNEKATSWGLDPRFGQIRRQFSPDENVRPRASLLEDTRTIRTTSLIRPCGRRWSRGAPILNDAVSALDCVLERQTLSGTHLILVGRIVDIWLGGSADTLLYCAGAFGQFRKE